LLRQAGLPIEEVRVLTEEEARERLNEFWSRSREGDQ
jgi:hypothetical protein